MNYVIWNNKDSRDIKGLLISELPPITRPKMRVKETVIDGVDGSIIEEIGYESYDKPMVIGLKIGADIDEISEFFSGSGEVVFSNEPDKYYKATISNRIDFQRLLRYRVAQVTFRVQPFKYSRIEVPREAIYTERNNLLIENVGNHTAKPIITLTGREEVQIFIDGQYVFDYVFPEDEDTVVIDCEKQDAYLINENNGAITLKNRNMGGDFPVLKKGSSNISWGGILESIRIEKYSRWL